MERGYKDVANAFLGALLPALVSGARILYGSVLIWSALVRTIVNLKWKQGDLATASGGACRPARAAWQRELVDHEKVHAVNTALPPKTY